MATYEVEFGRKQRMYPSLYADDNDGEEGFLHYLFFVNGNDYKWQDGELVDVFDDYTREYLLAMVAEAEAFQDDVDAHSRYVTRIIKSKKKMRSTEPAKTPAEEIRKRKIQFDEFLVKIGGKPFLDYDDPPEHLINAKQPVRKIYPICEYAKCMNVPDDIKPDWLVAARRALEVARLMVRTESDDEYLAVFEQRINELEVKESSDGTYS